MTPADLLRGVAEKKTRCIVGLMSGTSMDGIDAARVRISGSGRETRIVLEAFVTVPFSDLIRQQIRALCEGKGIAESVARVHFALGKEFAGAAASVMTPNVDVIASHGQTITHKPPYATLQIGQPAVIAQRLGVPVVSDFRTADVAVGGQGAPLIPFADWCLLTHPTRTRAIQNIGGIGNVTFLPADAAASDVLGFDTGPGNMLMDQAAQWATHGASALDRDGALAASGTVQTDWLQTLLTHPFLRQTPPKSAGREDFGDRFWENFCASAPPLDHAQHADVVATMTSFTAKTITDAYRRFLPTLPDEVIVGGGGARNPTLLRMLQENLAPILVRTHEEVGLNSDAKEAIAFAILANELLLGNCANLPSVTGASRPVRLGSITLP